MTQVLCLRLWGTKGMLSREGKIIRAMKQKKKYKWGCSYSTVPTLTVDWIIVNNLSVFCY